jgi:diacylglycerol O-acyltransferase
VLPSKTTTPSGTPSSATPPETRLAGAVSPQRAIAGLTIALDDLRPARTRTGATVNDLFLAAVTAGLRSYLPGWTGEQLPDSLLALVPRDVRKEEEAGVIGNRGWSMHVPLPIGLADRDDRIAAIRAATEAGKQLDRTAGAGSFRFDIALTNVRLGGPHAVGRAKVVGYSGAVPLQGENRLVGTALSYLGDLNVTFTADGAAFPDVERLAELTAAGFKELS